MGKNKFESFHDCDLPIDYEHILPGLPPNAPCCLKFQRFLFKMILVSEKHSRAKQFFRSTAAFTQEKRRHVRSKHWYIVHPFSKFRTAWEGFMAIVLTLSLIILPFIATFLTADPQYHYLSVKQECIAYYVASAIDFTCLIDIGINFITGYIKEKTKEIIMDQKRISKHYLRGFFFIDLVSSLPLDLVRVLTVYVYKAIAANKIFDIVCLASSVLKIFRIKTVIKYLSQFAQVKGFQGHGMRMLRVIVIMTIYIQWMTCTHFFVPRVIYYNKPPQQINNKSWIKKSNTFNKDPWAQYTASLLRTISNLCSVGYGHDEPESPEDILVCAFNQLTGFIVLAYFTVVVLQQQQSHHASVTKYLELMNQLHDYMDHRQLPRHLQMRLIAYYEHGYHRRYFREYAIMETLSDTLRQEINMHMCRKLVKNVVIFHGLSHNVISNIIKYLKLEVYLTNDVIIKAGTPGDCMYFLSSGTVAVISPSGKELCHMEDGAYFGEVTLVTPEKIRTASAVAASICEVYRLDQKDFAQCVQTNEILLQNMASVANNRRAELDDLERSLQSFEDDEIYSLQDKQ